MKKIVCLLAVAVLLAACARQPASSAPSSSSPENGAASVPGASPASVSPAPSRPSSNESVPVEGAVPVQAGELSLLDGDWHHKQNGEDAQMGYQYRFHQDGRFMISYGVMSSGNGSFFHGDVSFVENGRFTASVRESYVDAPEDLPLAELTFSAAWVGESKERVVFTLETAETESELFHEVFDSILGEPLVYERV